MRKTNSLHCIKSEIYKVNILYVEALKNLYTHWNGCFNWRARNNKHDCSKGQIFHIATFNYHGGESLLKTLKILVLLSLLPNYYYVSSIYFQNFQHKAHSTFKVWRQVDHVINNVQSIMICPLPKESRWVVQLKHAWINKKDWI